MGREKFSALDMLSKRSLPERKEKQAIIYKDPRELVPTQENFYTTKNISKLKASIKITGYLMQPILMQHYVRISWQCFIHSETITEITLIILLRRY